jgi:hypothetical protein
LQNPPQKKNDKQKQSGMLLNKFGNGLLDCHDGSALHMISKANGSANTHMGIILNMFPGFREYVNLDALPDIAPSHCRREAARGAAPTSVVLQ